MAVETHLCEPWHAIADCYHGVQELFVMYMGFSDCMTICLKVHFQELSQLIRRSYIHMISSITLKESKTQY